MNTEERERVVIKPEELRIGSVLFDEKGKLFKVDGQRLYWLDLFSEDDDNWVRKSLPIALTTEILEKVGFVEIDDIDNHSVDIFQLGEFCIYVSNFKPQEFYMNIVKEGDGNNFQPHFKYLYQLQNAFALTGEELIINL